MSDSPYDPSPETLDRIGDRAAAEAAAERVAGDGDLKAAVDKLKQVERELEAAARNAPAPPSSGVTYLPEVRPNPAPGRLTVPRIELRKPNQRTTMRAISAQPLVKLGFANVVNDGEGDVRADLRWGRVALFATPFVVLAIVGIWRIANVEDRSGTTTPSSTSTSVVPPVETAPATAATAPSAMSSADVAPTAEVAPTADVASTAEVAPPPSTTATSRVAPDKTSVPAKSSSDRPAGASPRPSGWKPEF